VDARPLPAPAPGFAGVHDLAAATAGALRDGAHGVVIVSAGDAPEETAWALDLLHQGDAPLVLAADPAGVADAIGVAAAAPNGCGCLLVAGGEVHAARHVHRSGHGFTSPEAGPMGRVSGGTVRLLWRPPERLTVRGPYDTASPRVGLHVLTLGEDGEPLAALARLCDGLVVAGSAVPEQLAPALAEAASRIPVVLASPAPAESAIPATTLDPRKARVLMHFLLAAGRDHESVLAAFTTAAGHTAAEL
jgi:L-asparaginase